MIKLRRAGWTGGGMKPRDRRCNGVQAHPPNRLSIESGEGITKR
ncbi:hypothetical protein [Phormidium sp. CCY1219]|nr:hypothetical protein [Phormidium sp. CCY1219]